MLDLLFLAMFAALAAGVGRALAGRLAPLPARPADALSLTVPLGLGVLSLSVLGLGQVGLITTAGMVAVGALAAILSLVAWRLPSVPASTTLPTNTRPLEERPPRRPIDAVFDIALAAVIAGSLLTALGPVTDGDALCYHLQVPKVFLAERAVGYDPDLHETVYPLLTELLYAVGLSYRGPVACRLIQWCLGLVFAANVTALARPAVGGRARWAGTIALLVPAVSNGMGAPLNDVALAAYGLAALHAWVRWLDRPTVGSAILSGVLAGLALGVKYPALIWVGLLGLALLGSSLWRRSAHRAVGAGGLGSLCAFAAAALLVGGIWYGRAYYYTGNPVYPFFRHTFKGSGIDDVLDPTKRPMTVTAGNLLLAPALMTLQPDRFDSFAHQFGPAFLMFLPGLILWRPPRRVTGLVALGWLFLTLCLTRRQSMRFVLIAVGPAALGVAWVAVEAVRRRSPAARGLVAALTGLLLFQSAIALGHARHGLPVVFGLESAHAYLARREPTFLIGRWIGANLPAGARLIGQDHRGFYLPRPYAMELAHRRRTGLGSGGETAEAIVARLRAEGFSHLLLCPPVPETAVEFDPTLSRTLAGWLARHAPLYRQDLSDADGIVRRYAIYELSGERPLAPPRHAGRDRR
jgi:hypothetical protein